MSLNVPPRNTCPFWGYLTRRAVSMYAPSSTARSLARSKIKCARPAICLHVPIRVGILLLALPTVPQISFLCLNTLFLAIFPAILFLDTLIRWFPCLPFRTLDLSTHFKFMSRHAQDRGFFGNGGAKPQPGVRVQFVSLGWFTTHT